MLHQNKGISPERGRHEIQEAERDRDLLQADSDGSRVTSVHQGSKATHPTGSRVEGPGRLLQEDEIYSKPDAPKYLKRRVTLLTKSWRFFFV